MRVSRNVPLSVKAANILRRLLQEEYSEGGRLPGEIELAERLGVNRGTVRQALSILEQEGAVIRRQGSGTYANKHVLGISMRLERFQEFTDLIRDAGYQPAVVSVGVGEEPASEELAERLVIEAETPLLVNRELLLADGQPAIYVEDAIPLTRIKEPYEESEMVNSVFKFLERRCHALLEYGLSVVVPRICGSELSSLLHLEPWEPLLQLNSTYFTKKNEPVMASRGYYRRSFVQFTVLRRHM